MDDASRAFRTDFEHLQALPVASKLDPDRWQVEGDSIWPMELPVPVNVSDLAQPGHPGVPALDSLLSSALKMTAQAEHSSKMFDNAFSVKMEAMAEKEALERRLREVEATLHAADQDCNDFFQAKQKQEQGAELARYTASCQIWGRLEGLHSALAAAAGCGYAGEAVEELVRYLQFQSATGLCTIIADLLPATSAGFDAFLETRPLLASNIAARIDRPLELCSGSWDCQGHSTGMYKTGLDAAPGDGTQQCDEVPLTVAPVANESLAADVVLKKDLYPEEFASSEWDEDPIGHRSGYVAIVGRPNAGKSTLVNALAGQKLSIDTPKAPTTQHRIVSLLDQPDSQMILLDTPGVLTTQRIELDAKTMHSVRKAASDANAVLAIIDASINPQGDLDILNQIFEAVEARSLPLAIVLNKVDLIPPGEIEALRASLEERSKAAVVIPTSAKLSTGVEDVKTWVTAQLLEGPSLYPKVPTQPGRRP